MNDPQLNRLLRAARERSGLSRNALAEAVGLWLAERDPKGRDVAFDANHLGKIERGIVQRPRAPYVAALCAILGTTEANLGFDHSCRATPEDVDRQAFLQVALVTGAGALITRHFSDHDATDLVATIAGPTAHYRRMSDGVSTTELSPAVEAHLRLASSVVTNALPTRDGFAALSDAALLAAYIARDRGDIGSARRHYATAVSSAERAQHPLLSACTLLARGTFAIESGEPNKALELFQRARRQLDGRDAPDSAHALLASFHAAAYAWMGDRSRSLNEMRSAASLIGSHRMDPAWPWVFVFDASKAARYEASTLAKLNDLTAARKAFAAAVPSLAPKALAEAKVDHAGVLARSGHLDEANALAMEAFSTARQYGSDRIVQKVRALPVVVRDRFD
jgi:transcriptional regulator with XRE-family HTH domain